MAVVPIISTLSFNTLATIGTITDTSVYGSPARNTLGVYLEFWKMDTASVATVKTVTPNSSDPKLVTAWTFASTVDGWYKARIYLISDYAGGTAYTTGQVVYYASTNNIYRATQATTGNVPTNATYWALATLVDAAAANNVTNAYQDYLVIEAGKTCAAEAAGDWAKEEECGGCTKTNFTIPTFQKRLMVIAAQRFAAISVYNKAEDIARKLEKACESC